MPKTLHVAVLARARVLRAEIAARTLRTETALPRQQLFRFDVRHPPAVLALGLDRQDASTFLPPW